MGYSIIMVSTKTSRDDSNLLDQDKGSNSYNVPNHQTVVTIAVEQ